MSEVPLYTAITCAFLGRHSRQGSDFGTHPADNPGANMWFLSSIPLQMPPESGVICGRLTQDLPLGCLQSGCAFPPEQQRPRANSAHLRQCRPDSGLGFQVEYLIIFSVSPSWLGSGNLRIPSCPVRAKLMVKLYMQTLVIYKFDFNHNYFTLTFILLIKNVLCTKLP